MTLSVRVTGRSTTFVVDGDRTLTVRGAGAGRLTTVDVGRVGPQGATGPSGAAGSVLAKTAGEAIGGHRVVVSDGADDVLLADIADASHLHRVLGVTEGAAILGDPISVRYAGEMAEAGWSWTPGSPIYAGASGVLTQTPPSSAWLRIVAVAESATRIAVGLREPVRLA